MTALNAALTPREHMQEEPVPKELTMMVSEEDRNLDRTMAAIEAEGPEIAARWLKRQMEAGTRRYYSPFARGSERQYFPDAASCAAHMAEVHGAQVAQAIVTGQPRASYSPQFDIIPPKMRPEDVMALEHVRFMATAEQVAAATTGITRNKTESAERADMINKFVHGTSAEWPTPLESQPTDVLLEVYELANNFGRRELRQELRLVFKARKVDTTGL
jgi:hypothetical protein